MKPSDLFTWVQLPDWGEKRPVLDADLIESFKFQPQEGVSDVEAAYAMAQLANDELLAYGTQGNNTLGNEDLSVILRSLRATLKRLGIKFDLPLAPSNPSAR